MTAYATSGEFDLHGIRPEARPTAVLAGDITSAIDAASKKADSYLRNRFSVPLASWGLDLTQAICAMAAYELVASLLLFQPEAGANQILVARNEAAIKWLREIADGHATPEGVTSSAPAGVTDVTVSSDEPRGW
jgi:phage gp36-like protein